jgi:hypothetical protein
MSKQVVPECALQRKITIASLSIERDPATFVSAAEEECQRTSVDAFEQRCEPHFVPEAAQEDDSVAGGVLKNAGRCGFSLMDSRMY